MKTMSKSTVKLVQALRSGKKLSAATIRARYGAANPSATISWLRRSHDMKIVNDDGKYCL